MASILSMSVRAALREEEDRRSFLEGKLLAMVKGFGRFLEDGEVEGFVVEKEEMVGGLYREEDRRDRTSHAYPELQIMNVVWNLR